MKVYFALLIVLILNSCSRKSDTPIGHFINYFEKATSQPNFSDEDVERLFSEYSQLMFPYSTNPASEQNGLVYPLSEIKTNPDYQKNIQQLLSSENENHRMLAYVTIGASNDTAYASLLRERIKTEKSEQGLAWSAMALMYMRDNHTTELFDFLIAHEDFGDTHFISTYILLPKDSLIPTCRKKVLEDNTKSKALALQVLAEVDEHPSTDSLIREAVRTWHSDVKGYAIAALRMRKLGDVKELVEPFLNDENLRQVTLQTLLASPTEADSLFAIEVKSKNNW